MCSIRGLLGFQFWVDNNKRDPIEALLDNRDRTSKKKAAILKDLLEESQQHAGSGLSMLSLQMNKK